MLPNQLSTEISSLKNTVRKTRKSGDFVLQIDGANDSSSDDLDGDDDDEDYDNYPIASVGSTAANGEAAETPIEVIYVFIFIFLLFVSS